jgi:glutamyl-tRNA(Gln) amidotransferase subunit D
MFGYRGKVLRLLKSLQAEVGDRLRIESRGRVYEGILMPRSELGDPDHVVIKLDSGYNLGIRVAGKVKITKVGRGKVPRLGLPPIEIKRDPNKPDVTIVGTGGTIASRVDYRTGAVFPSFTPQEIYSAVPELADIANIKVKEACNVLSENMTPRLWIKTGRAVANEINDGAKGVVVAHGTDTMGYTAAALSFMLRGLFRPVVLVGSQRSSDRPSSDAAMNLISSVVVAGRSDIAEVCVVMHGSMNDDFCLIHRGTKVRKCHTSRRDAFQTINDLPLGMVRGGNITLLREDYRRATNEGKVEVDDKFEEKVAIVKVFPNMSGEIIEALLDMNYKGIVLEGTGLGHTPKSLFASIKKAIGQGVPVVMTSQCIWGRINMNVYSTGRDLLRIGVIPGEDLLPEVAYVKLMWLLPKTSDLDELRKLMLTDYAGEITGRTKLKAFMDEWMR